MKTKMTVNEKIGESQKTYKNRLELLNNSKHELELLMICDEKPIIIPLSFNNDNDYFLAEMQDLLNALRIIGKNARFSIIDKRIEMNSKEMVKKAYKNIKYMPTKTIGSNNPIPIVCSNTLEEQLGVFERKIILKGLEIDIRFFDIKKALQNS